MIVNDNTSDDIMVYSPPFDFTNQNDPVLSMDIKLNLYNQTSNAGHVKVEYSTNGGTSWTRLGVDSDSPWYDQAPAYRRATWLGRLFLQRNIYN